MSAYLCSDTHTCVLALYAARRVLGNAPRTAMVTTLAQNLRYLNNHALSCRYDDKPEPLADDIMPALARATAWLESASPADIFGAVKGFRYQCAEGNTPELEEWKLLEAIYASAEFKAGGASSDVWAIDDNTPPPVNTQTAPNDWQAKQAAKLSIVEALRAANPHLVPANGKGGSLVAAAKNCRIELKAAFPGVKFSVRTSRFSGGDSIDVQWTDGPTSDQVSSIVDRYSAGHFNGLDDSYNYSDSAWTAAFGDAKYVKTKRDDSDSAIESAIRTVRAKYSGNFESKCIATPSAADYRAGKLWNVQIIEGAYHCDGLQSVISRELHRRTWALPRRAANSSAPVEA